MRIVIGNPRKVWGGASTTSVDLALGLQDRGHDVLVLASPKGPLIDALDGKVPVEPVLHGWDLSPRAILRIARILRRHGTQVVLSQTSKDLRLTVPAARLLNIPCAMVWHAAERLEDSLKHRVFVGRLPTHYIAVSPSARDAAVESFEWLAPERIVTIPHGIRMERFEGVSAADLGLPADALAIGYIARISRAKGGYDLLAAWDRIAEAIPNAHLVLVGVFEDDALEAEFGARPRIHTLGYRTDVPELLAALDILVHPSHNESFGRVVAEALAAGVPCVATPVGSIPEWVEDGITGRIVPVEAPGRIAEAVLTLAHDVDRRVEMGRAGRERVRERLSLDAMISKYERVLTEIGG